MIIKRKDSAKIVEVWLTNAEKDDPEVHESLKPLYKEYKEKKYLVAVFMSGTQDLYELTRDLLIYNRRRMAEREVKAEREAAERAARELAASDSASEQNSDEDQDEGPRMSFGF